MKRWFSLLLCLLMLGGCVPGKGELPAETEMKLFAVNVGKGDCLLLQSGQSLYMIDTGRAQNWGAISAALKLMEVQRLTGVIVTHTDSDHAGGCAALAASNIQVDTWYASKFYNGVKTSKHPVKLAAETRGQKVVWIGQGDELPFDGGRLTVLGPRVKDMAENCNSVVLLAEGGGGSMLLTGDMEFPEEEDLLGAGLIPACTVLKVGNHAESDATSEALIRTVNPKIAVISTSTSEEPDTPAPRVLRLLRHINAEVLNTQHAEAGVMVTLRNGEATTALASYQAVPPMEYGIRLVAKDNRQHTTTVSNQGDHPVDVSGWFIRSERGNEIFVFPSGAVLQAGQTVLITCESSPAAGDYRWNEDKVWHKSKADPGVLYDVYGRQINRIE